MFKNYFKTAWRSLSKHKAYSIINVLGLIAFFIAAPIAYYVMNNWLQNFAYKIKIGANIFVIAILASFVIAACTIAYEAIKAAIANPVKSLRTE